MKAKHEKRTPEDWHISLGVRRGQYPVFYDEATECFTLKNTTGPGYNWVSSGGKYKNIRPNAGEINKAIDMQLAGAEKYKGETTNEYHALPR